MSSKDVIKVTPLIGENERIKSVHSCLYELESYTAKNRILCTPIIIKLNSWNIYLIVHWCKTHLLKASVVFQKLWKREFKATLIIGNFLFSNNCVSKFIASQICLRWRWVCVRLSTSIERYPKPHYLNCDITNGCSHRREMTGSMLSEIAKKYICISEKAWSEYI